MITSENFISCFFSILRQNVCCFCNFEVISRRLFLNLTILELDSKHIHFPIVKMNNLRLKLRDVGGKGSHNSRYNAYCVLVGALYSKPSYHCKIHR